MEANELGAWVRSDFCDTGACLEATTTGDHVSVRSSADPAGPQLSVSGVRWNAFLAELKGFSAPAR